MRPDKASTDFADHGSGEEALSVAIGSERPSARLVAGGAIGNMLEWYDFGVYGFLASVFARNFFPDSSAFIGLLSAFGMFAASFLMRPLGGILFGRVGDRLGRRQALFLSAMMMTLSTVSIGLLPTAASVGAMAPVLLLALRLLQGISVGGEQAAAGVFLSEAAPPRRRGLLASLSVVGATLGTLLGSAVGASVASLLSPQDMADWGWRVPFLLGLVLGGAALILRAGKGEPEPDRTATPKAPLREAVRAQGRQILHAMLIVVAEGNVFYLAFVFLATYMQKVDGLPLAKSLQMSVFGMVVVLIASPAAALLSDRIGRKKVLLAALVGLILCAWPVFRLLSSDNLPQMIAGQVILALLASCYGGPMPAALCELFQRRTRCTAYAIAWNCGVGWVGGLTPMLTIYLMHRFDSPMAPAVMVIVLSCVSLAGVLAMTDKSVSPI